MTKSTITRERLEQLADNNTICKVSWDERIELAQIALAAMDSSESVEMPLDYLQGHKDGLEWAAQLAEANHPETGDWLYDDPIELAKAIRKGPDMPPAQPAPVVPELMVDWQENEFSAGWNACRAAMLQELKKSAGTEAICRSDENVQVLHTKSPAQSDCCPAQNHVSPEQNGDTPAQSQGWIQVSEQMPPSRHEVLVGRWWGEKPRWCCKWATYIPGHPDAQSSGWLIPGASWTPTHWMPLPAEPQEVKSES